MADRSITNRGESNETTAAKNKLVRHCLFC